MIKKTTRKNKTNQVVKYPSNENYFTVKSLLADNSDMVPITLRVRLQKAINETKTVSVIGYKNNGKGRPTLAFALSPVSKTALLKAQTDGITLKTPTTVPVMSLDSNTSKVETTPIVVNEEIKDSVVA